MSKRHWFLSLIAVLAVSMPVWLSGAAQAGAEFVCGDGVIEAPELCDDSNTVTGDGCSHPSCLPEVCGDSIVNPDPPGEEQCDDGNTVDDDDCNNLCQSVGPQNKPQQACINAINKNLAGVVKAQTADTATCIKDVAAGKVAAVADCYGADAKGKVAKAKAKTDTTITKKCTGEQGGLTKVPGIAFTDAATVNGTSTIIVEGSSDVFGGPPTSIVLKSADKDGAKCQAEIIKQHNLVVNKWIAEANKAKKNALKGKGAAPVETELALVTAIETALQDSVALDKTVTKVATAVDKKCPTTVPVDPLVECNAAATGNDVSVCIANTAREAACKAFEAADGLDMNCIEFPPVP